MHSNKLHMLITKKRQYDFAKCNVTSRAGEQVPTSWEGKEVSMCKPALDAIAKTMR